jgi:DNA-directed RNA polymerase subunit alpha
MLPKLSLNLKQVRFKRQIEDIDNESVTISVSGKDQLLLVIFKNLFQVSSFEPRIVICNLDSKIKLTSI